MPTIKKILFILSPVEKATLLMVMITISFIGHDSIASIFPFISVLTNPDNRINIL